MSDKKEKTFKEIHGKTRVGKWLKEKAPSLLGTVLNVAGDLIPGGSAFKTVVSGLIGESQELTPESMEHTLKLLDRDITEYQEVTKRWEADSKSNAWLPKNIRPMVLGYLVIIVSILAFLDSSIEGFTVKEHWVSLFSSLLITTIAAYFGLREFGKYTDKRYK